MPRPKYQTLTEQMFYVLLCLKTECYGVDIFERIDTMTGGRVAVGSGTLYNLLQHILDAGKIREVEPKGRRRSYILTDAGREALRREYQRLQSQIADYAAIWKEEEGI